MNASHMNLGLETYVNLVGIEMPMLGICLEIKYSWTPNSVPKNLRHQSQVSGNVLSLCYLLADSTSTMGYRFSSIPSLAQNFRLCTYSPVH
jgi:hypothetical protein